MPRYFCRLGTEVDRDGEKRVVPHPPGCGHGARADRAGIDCARPGKAWDNLQDIGQNSVSVDTQNAGKDQAQAKPEAKKKTAGKKSASKAKSSDEDDISDIVSDTADKGRKK